MASSIRPASIGTVGFASRKQIGAISSYSAIGQAAFMVSETGMGFNPRLPEPFPWTPRI